MTLVGQCFDCKELDVKVDTCGICLEDICEDCEMYDCRLCNKLACGDCSIYKEKFDGCICIDCNKKEEKDGSN